MGDVCCDIVINLADELTSLHLEQCKTMHYLSFRSAIHHPPFYSTFFQLSFFSFAIYSFYLDPAFHGVASVRQLKIWGRMAKLQLVEFGAH